MPAYVQGGGGNGWHLQVVPSCWDLASSHTLWGGGVVPRTLAVATGGICNPREVRAAGGTRLQGLPLLQPLSYLELQAVPDHGGHVP